MRKLLAIGSALLIFLQSVNIHFDDLLEMESLVTHYQFHAGEYGDNFMVFLSKHYGKLKASHEENHREELPDHEQLPFQSQTHCTQMHVFVAEASQEIQSGSDGPVYVTDNFHYQISYSSVWGDGPFQPPKSV